MGSGKKSAGGAKPEGSAPQEPAALDPKRVAAELEEAFGKKAVSPALTAVLAKYGEIAKWLTVPENAAAFKADPVKALNEAFPKLNLPSASPPPTRAPISIGIRPAPADQATTDFFLEVWAYVATSPANRQVFEAGQRDTIALLGSGKPATVVQPVIDAFERLELGTGAAVADLVRIVREEILDQVSDPVGPVSGLQGSALTQAQLPFSEGREG